MNYIILVFAILSFLVLFRLLTVIETKMNNDFTNELVKNYSYYMDLLNKHMENAFNVIYKEKMLIYSIEATRIKEADFQTCSKDFGLLTLKMIGPTLKKALISIYGDEETLFLNVIQYFNERYENDEILKASKDNLLNGETQKLPVAEVPKAKSIEYLGGR